MSTEEIDQRVYQLTKEMGGIPAPLNYEGFPKSVCTSINDQVCHGIPSKDVILQDGDIINVDVSTIYNGYFSDSSRMFCLGNVSEENRKLVQVTKECVELGLAEVKPWDFLGMWEQLSANMPMPTATRWCVRSAVMVSGWSSTRALGRLQHQTGEEMLLVPGLMFTIEPMVNMGTQQIYTDQENGWESTQWMASPPPSGSIRFW